MKETPVFSSHRLMPQAHATLQIFSESTNFQSPKEGDCRAFGELERHKIVSRAQLAQFELDVEVFRACCLKWCGNVILFGICFPVGI